MAEKVCPFEDIKEGHSFSGALASFWKIKVVWGRFGPNNAMRQDNGIKVCFADVQPVTLLFAAILILVRLNLMAKN